MAGQGLSAVDNNVASVTMAALGQKLTVAADIRDRQLSARSRQDIRIKIMDIPAGVRPLFVAAGWQSGRRFRVDGRVPKLHPAYDVLREVGCLHVGRSELGGIECARSDLE